VPSRGNLKPRRPLLIYIHGYTSTIDVDLYCLSRQYLAYPIPQVNGRSEQESCMVNDYYTECMNDKFSHDGHWLFCYVAFLVLILIYTVSLWQCYNIAYGTVISDVFTESLAELHQAKLEVSILKFIVFNYFIFVYQWPNIFPASE
jgi:hypothetical protein